MKQLIVVFLLLSILLCWLCLPLREDFEYPNNPFSITENELNDLTEQAEDRYLTLRDILVGYTRDGIPIYKGNDGPHGKIGSRGFFPNGLTNKDAFDNFMRLLSKSMNKMKSGIQNAFRINDRKKMNNVPIQMEASEYKVVHGGYGSNLLTNEKEQLSKIPKIHCPKDYPMLTGISFKSKYRGLDDNLNQFDQGKFVAKCAKMDLTPLSKRKVNQYFKENAL